MVTCGCSIRRGQNENANEDTIKFCRKHESVDDLLTAAKSAITLIKAETKLTPANKTRTLEAVLLLETAINVAE